MYFREQMPGEQFTREMTTSHISDVSKESHEDIAS
jgi:hypothetical protein